MQNIQFNINESVKVKLTDFGLRILRENHTELKLKVPSLPEFIAPSVDDEGYSTFQLWDLMEVFGQYMYMGAREYPFEMNIIIQKQD